MKDRDFYFMCCLIIIMVAGGALIGILLDQNIEANGVRGFFAVLLFVGPMFLLGFSLRELMYLLGKVKKEGE